MLTLLTCDLKYEIKITCSKNLGKTLAKLKT